LECHHTV